jgi:hypothetical protein
MKRQKVKNEYGPNFEAAKEMVARLMSIPSFHVRPTRLDRAPLAEHIAVAIRGWTGNDSSSCGMKLRKSPGA